MPLGILYRCRRCAETASRRLCAPRASQCLPQGLHLIVPLLLHHLGLAKSVSQTLVLAVSGLELLLQLFGR